MVRKCFAIFFFVFSLTSLHALSLQNYLNATCGHYDLAVYSNGNDLWAGANEGFHLPPAGYRLTIEIKWLGQSQRFSLDQNGTITTGKIIYKDLGRDVPLLEFIADSGADIGGAWFWNRDIDQIEYSGDGIRVSSFDMNLQRIKRIKGQNYGQNTCILYFMLSQAKGAFKMSGLWMLTRSLE